MIYAYGVSLPGTYHLNNDIVCQDYHKIIRCGRKMAIAAVADGLGSAQHSDIGSEIAATVAVEHCRLNITPVDKASDILDALKVAFMKAQRAIEKEAANNDRDLEQYDTTLTVAVMIRSALYYGHSGDSGMIALTTSGRYEQVTTQQRDSESRVFPLFFSDRWEFARYNEEVSSILLATDGMLEIFFPIYIKDDPVNIHVSLAQFFMDNNNLHIDKVGREAVQTRFSGYMESIPDEKVNDDKTIAVLVNTSVRTKRQPMEYYKEPDWTELKRKYDEAWKREAYPGLFVDTKTAITPKPAQTSENKSKTAPSVQKLHLSLPLSRLRGMSISKSLMISIVSMTLAIVLLIAVIALRPFKGRIDSLSVIPPTESDVTPESAPPTPVTITSPEPTTPPTTTTPASLESPPPTPSTPTSLVPASPYPDPTNTSEPTPQPPDTIASTEPTVQSPATTTSPKPAPSPNPDPP